MGVKASKECVPSPGVARGFIKTLGSFERHPRPRVGAFSRALAGRAEIGPRRGPRGGEGPVCELSPRWDGPVTLRAENLAPSSRGGCPSDRL